MTIHADAIFYHVSSMDVARHVFLRGLPARASWADKEEAFNQARMLEDAGIKPMVIPIKMKILEAFGPRADFEVCEDKTQHSMLKNTEDEVKQSIIIHGTFRTSKVIPPLTLIKAFPPLRDWSESIRQNKRKKKKQRK